MRISIFGLGYVGCVSLGCLAKNGHRVIGVDVSQTKIDLINQGKPTIIEDGLDEIIREVSSERRIYATADPLEAVRNSEISIIAVGTPSTKEGHLDLGTVYRVAEEIGEALAQKEEFHIIVIRSTVLPGTNQKIGGIIEKSSGKCRNKDFAVVSNPEFLREGFALRDYYDPSVTVIGTDNERAGDKIAALYADLPAPVQKVDIAVAELIKYVNNAWHALKITFANEIGNICKGLQIDSHQVMDLFIMDHKLNLSAYYLKPGSAYGGSCLPKDLKGLGTIAHDHYLKTLVLENIENSNNYQKQVLMDMIVSTRKRKIGLIGLSFKAGTDDLRYSPFVELAEYLLGKGYEIAIYDKNVNLSKLMGSNKDFIESHIPYLSHLITDDLDDVVARSETVVIAHRIAGIEHYMDQYPDKHFIDLVRVTNRRRHNYEGICW